MRKTLLIVGAILFIVAAAAGLVGYQIVFGSNTTGFEGERSVKLPPGSRFDAVADSLESAGILRSRTTFELVGKATGWASQVKAGHYTFKEAASNYQMLDVIRKGLQTPVRLTIPPGSRPEVVAAVASKAMAFEKEDFLEALNDTTLAAELSTDTRHLFGYMLPDTYHFYWLTDARTVVKRIATEFDRFYNAEIKAAADSLGLDKGQVVTLASIVDWETAINEEKPRVAGVYLNRLRVGMPLQADPTVQYVVMQQEGKKRRLLYEDLRIDSPYNTYLFQGLPPGPITNPPRSSLLAVAKAEKHDLWYFVANGDGGHVFSRTHAEHARAAQRYYDLMRERRRQLREQQAAGQQR